MNWKGCEELVMTSFKLLHQHSEVFSSLVGSFIMLSVARLYSMMEGYNGRRMMNIKVMEGSIHGIIMVLPQNLPETIEETPRTCPNNWYPR
jgi:hypothetical protein